MSQALSKTRNLNIDQFRFFAMLWIIVAHYCASVRYMPTTLPHVPFWADFSGPILVLARFTVPFFFMVAGYFVKLSPPDQIEKTLLKLGSRLLIPFFLWVSFYLLFEASINDAFSLTSFLSLRGIAKLILNGGPAYHLWFLTSLFFCLVCLQIGNLFLSPKKLLAISLLLFLLGLLFYPYAELFFGHNTPLSFNTRNGPFQGMIFLCIGAFGKDFLNRASLWTGLLLLFFGGALELIEASFLQSRFGLPMEQHDILLGTLFYGIGGFIVALRLPFQSAFLAEIGKLTMGIYIFHLLFLKIGLLYFPNTSFFDGVGLILFAFLGSWGLTAGLARIPSFKWLVS